MISDFDYEAKAELALLALRDEVNNVLEVAHLGGVISERKRIIEALEAYRDKDFDCQCEGCRAALALIDIIQGDE